MSIESWDLPVNPETDVSIAKSLDEEETRVENSKNTFLKKPEDYAAATYIPLAAGVATGGFAGNLATGILTGGTLAMALALEESRSRFRGSEERRSRLNRVSNLRENTVYFDGENDYSEDLPDDQDITEAFAGLIQDSEEVQFEDFYFPEEVSLHDFGAKPAQSFYEKLLKEPSTSSLRHGGDNEHIDHFLTVDQTEGEMDQYVLDIGVNYELSGRITGYTDQDLETFLEAGEDGYNTNIKF